MHLNNKIMKSEEEKIYHYLQNILGGNLIGQQKKFLKYILKNIV